MGHNSSLPAKLTPGQANKITNILTENPDYEEDSDNEIPPRMTLYDEPSSLLSIRIRETNKSMEFLKDFLVIYSQPAENGINLNTTPLLGLNAMAVGQSNNLDHFQRLERSWDGNSMSASRSIQNPVKQHVRKMIVRTQSVGAPLKEVMKNMKRDKYSKFSFNRQRMDFHVEPAKFSRVVGSYSNMNGSQQRNFDSYGRNGNESNRDTFGSKESPRNKGKESRYLEEEPPKYLTKQRSSPEEAPKFGALWKDNNRDNTRESRLERTFDVMRREKKEKDGKTHESLLLLKDDIERIKSDLDRSKSIGKDQNRQPERGTNYERTPPPVSNNYSSQNRIRNYYELEPQGSQKMYHSQPNIQGQGAYDQHGYQNPNQYNSGFNIPQNHRENLHQSQPSFPKPNHPVRKIEDFKNEEREHISGDPIENSKHKLYSNRHPPQNDDGYYTQRNEIRRPLEPQEYPRSQSPMNTSGCNPLAYEKEKMTPQERKPTVHSKGMDPFNRPRTAQIKVEERPLNQINQWSSVHKMDNRSQMPHIQQFSQSQDLSYDPKLRNLYPNPNSSVQKHHVKNASPHSRKLSPPSTRYYHPEEEMNVLHQSKNNHSGANLDFHPSYSLEEENDQPVSINLNLEDLLNDSHLAEQHLNQYKGSTHKKQQQSSQMNNIRMKETKSNNYPNRNNEPNQQYYLPNEAGNNRPSPYGTQSMVQGTNYGTSYPVVQNKPYYPQNQSGAPVDRPYEIPKMTSSVHYVNQDRRGYGQYQPSNQHNQQDRFLPQNQYQKQLSQSHLERNDPYRKTRWDERNEMPNYNSQYSQRNPMMSSGYNMHGTGSQSARLYQ